MHKHFLVPKFIKRYPETLRTEGAWSVAAASWSAAVSAGSFLIHSGATLGYSVFMSKVVILTGAGLSAESGVSTFRDSNGLWENHRIEDVCHIATWEQNFEKVHAFYNARRTQLAVVEPNAAHRAIADWEKRYDTLLLTQNVDDLLERAGCRDVVHLHGFLPQLRCVECGHIWSLGYQAWQTGSPCPAPGCGSVRGVKPNIVFFGEAAPQYSVLWEAFDATRPRDLFIVIGTSGVVLPVDSMASSHEGFKILNNLHRESAIDDDLFDRVFHEPATHAVAKIDAILRERLG